MERLRGMQLGQADMQTKEYDTRKRKRNKNRLGIGRRARGRES